MPHLDMLEITLRASISRREAVGMVGIRAKHFHLQLMETDSLGFLSQQQLEIHELTLWSLGDMKSTSLRMQAPLKILNIVGDGMVQKSFLHMWFRISEFERGEGQEGQGGGRGGGNLFAWLLHA